ncbi:MAG TPA: OsmC family protein [Longimicrobiales bacterium]|nr:OsmC family protein [Longimicrobiales bacterium]
MRILIEDERRIVLTPEGGDALSIVPAAPELGFSPLHMLAASFATCTLAALASWARVAELSMEGLVITLEWDYVEDPYRVGRYGMDIRWPAVPEERREVALRVARSCTVEHTLEQPPEIDVALV